MNEVFSDFFSGLIFLSCKIAVFLQGGQVKCMLVAENLSYGDHL